MNGEGKKEIQFLLVEKVTFDLRSGTRLPSFPAEQHRASKAEPFAGSDI